MTCVMCMVEMQALVHSTHNTQKVLMSKLLIHQLSLCVAIFFSGCFVAATDEETSRPVKCLYAAHNLLAVVWLSIPLSSCFRHALLPATLGQIDCHTGAVRPRATQLVIALFLPSTHFMLAHFIAIRCIIFFFKSNK